MDLQIPEPSPEGVLRRRVKVKLLEVIYITRVGIGEPRCWTAEGLDLDGVAVVGDVELRQRSPLIEREGLQVAVAEGTDNLHGRLFRPTALAQMTPVTFVRPRTGGADGKR